MRCWWFVFRKQYYSTTSVESCECVLTWNNHFKTNSKLDFKCYVEIAKNDNHIKILSWTTFAKSQTKCTKSWQRPTNNTIRLSICGWIQKNRSSSPRLGLYCIASCQQLSLTMQRFMCGRRAAYIYSIFRVSII